MGKHVRCNTPDNRATCGAADKCDQLREQIKTLQEEVDELRKSDVAQGLGGLEVVRVDGDATGRLMPDSVTIKSECCTVTYVDNSQLKVAVKALENIKNLSNNGGRFVNDYGVIAGQAINLINKGG